MSSNRCKICGCSDKSVAYSVKELGIISILRYCDLNGIYKTNEDSKGIRVKAPLECSKSIIDGMNELANNWGALVSIVGEQSYRIDW